MTDSEKQLCIRNTPLCFGDEDFSDFIISCRGHIWNVHRIVVCKKSRYLKDAWGQAQNCDGTRNVRLDDLHDPPTVHRLLEYLYENDYDDEVDFALHPAAHHSPSPQTLSPTTSTATALSLPPMDTSDDEKQLCVMRKEEDAPEDQFVVTRLLNNMRVHPLAEAVDLKNLLEAATEKIMRDSAVAWRLSQFLNIVEIAYETTERAAESEEQDGLRGLFAAVCTEHVSHSPKQNGEPLAAAMEKGVREEVSHKIQFLDRKTVELLEKKCKMEDLRHQDQTELERMRSDLTSKDKALTKVRENCTQLKKKYEQELEGQRRAQKVSLASADAEIAELEKKYSEMQAVMRKAESIASSGLLGIQGVSSIWTEKDTVGPDEQTYLYQSITSAPKYQQLSFEELRLAVWSRKHINKLPQTGDILPLDWKIDTLLRHMKSMEAKAGKKTSDLEKLKTKYDAVIAEPGKWTECRHCRVGMNGHFAPDSSGSEAITWRCNFCKSRHGNLVYL
ncbi:hypothetical protein H2199_000351 [Coniosporium tulheliwenetii]|uniref:Uncharacterized protein n=1 Tax=Coniosporium tulheliwenetii TaxID=3383036 RepID=A0ACC2ZPU1_9PEZI|nr:hypothetical protein H2199_000351 [Cladosporium sp. JES 115]